METNQLNYPSSLLRVHNQTQWAIIGYSTSDTIGNELEQLEVQGIIAKVTTSDWAAPIVAILKRDGSYGICGDYNVTANPVLEDNQYPLPKPSDLFASLAGGKFFPTSMSTAPVIYRSQLQEIHSEYNTHKGLYQYT
jgi:hypothetical protein